MKTWEFADGTRIEEAEFDYDLHILKVYNNGKHLGNIYPSDIEDMEKLFADLDNGSNPIEDCWEDGCGHTCAIDGWGKTLWEVEYSDWGMCGTRKRYFESEEEAIEWAKEDYRDNPVEITFTEEEADTILDEQAREDADNE